MVGTDVEESSRASMELSRLEPPVMQLLKNFLTFYGTRNIIIVFTRALHWSTIS
jgi:hypothetical protein